MQNAESASTRVTLRLAQVSCDAYRKVVRGDPRFIEFFQSATPVNELGRMNIGVSYMSCTVDHPSDQIYAFLGVHFQYLGPICVRVNMAEARFSAYTVLKVNVSVCMMISIINFITSCGT